jgi:hypothetical protein
MPEDVEEQPEPLDTLGALGAPDTGPMYLYTAAGASVSLEGFYRGQHCFLIGGGPSLKEANLGLLNAPGIVTWCMNNSWAVPDSQPHRFRPRLWTCVDPAEKFSDKGFRDPSITKVVPLSIANHRLRFLLDGEWRMSSRRVRDCPGVLFFRRNARFEPADFLCQSTVNWGMPEGQRDSLGHSGIRSVMLATLRLVHYMGFRRVYLLGADFKMEPGKGYAFEQERSKGSVKHNNTLYRVLNERLAALKPYLDMDDCRVFNCTPGSGLTAFPFKSLGDAAAEAGRDCAGPMETAGYYDTAGDSLAQWREANRHMWDHGGGD